MINKVVIYNNTTGHIEQNIKIAPSSLERMLTGRPYLSVLEHDLGGAIDDYCVNVSVDPHVIESKPEPTINIPQYCREYRTVHLKNTDWTVGVDSPLSDSKKAEWQTYRQALRDITSTYPNPSTNDDVIWPTAP